MDKEPPPPLPPRFHPIKVQQNIYVLSRKPIVYSTVTNDAPRAAPSAPWELRYYLVILFYFIIFFLGGGGGDPNHHADKCTLSTFRSPFYTLFLQRI